MLYHLISSLDRDHLNFAIMQFTDQLNFTINLQVTFFPTKSLFYLRVLGKACGVHHPLPPSSTPPPPHRTWSLKCYNFKIQRTFFIYIALLFFLIKYGEVNHTFVERKDYSGDFLPGYKKQTLADPILKNL